MTKIKRRLAERGLSYFDANHNRLVTLSDDVLGIKREIEDRWPELEVYWDDIGGPQAEGAFIVVEHCKDGIGRLVCEVPYLDPRLIRRLEGADTHRKGQEDPVALIDAYNDQVEKERDAEFSDQINAANERLHFALRKDGITLKPKVFIGNKPRSMCK